MDGWKAAFTLYYQCSDYCFFKQESQRVAQSVRELLSVWFWHSLAFKIFAKSCKQPSLSLINRLANEQTCSQRTSAPSIQPDNICIENDITTDLWKTGKRNLYKIGCWLYFSLIWTALLPATIYYIELNSLENTILNWKYLKCLCFGRQGLFAWGKHRFEP